MGPVIDWQTLGVVLVVGAAAFYLGRKVFGQDEPPPSPPSFVPLSQLRRSSGPAAPASPPPQAHHTGPGPTPR